MALPSTSLAQAVKPKTEINEMQSLQLTRNLIRIAISEISYIRGLFPEKYFLDRYLPALEMKVKKLMPVDTESKRLIDWMEKGVYDALQKKFLETLLFRLCDGEYGPMIEEYAFSFRYDVSSERVSMDITRSNRHGGKGKLMNTTSSDITPAQMKAAACKMIRTLVQLMRTLNNVPEQRTIIMQLYYHADTTPADYEPPFFRTCNYEDTKLWAKKPLEMKVGNVNSKHCEISLQLRSILDPCEDDTEICVKPEDKTLLSSTTGSDTPSTSHDFTSRVETAFAGSKHPPTLPDKKPASSTTGEDVRRVYDEQKAQLDYCDSQSVANFVSTIKQWAIEQRSTFDDIDLLANFSQAPMIVDKLVKEKFLERIDKDKYRVTKFEGRDLSCNQLPEDSGLHPVSILPEGRRLSSREHASTEHLAATHDTAYVIDEKMRLYEKALMLVLPMKHVTVRGLSNKLGENVSPSVVNHLLQRMGREGYIEITPSIRKLGRRVLRPLQETEDHLKEIVEKVKDVAIAEVDVHSDEGSVSDEARAEFRTKSRDDFGNYNSNCNGNPGSRTNNRRDSNFNTSNEAQRRSKKTADLCAVTISNGASRQYISDDTICSLTGACVPSADIDDYSDSKMRSLPTKSSEDSKHVAPDSSTPGLPRCPTANVSYSTPRTQEEKVGLPISSYGGRKSQDTDTECEKNFEKSQLRVRKASKVDEPIHQSLSSKRMRA